MPRSSLADRLDRASLSRGSAGKGSLGRYSIATDVSGSGSVSTRHWVNSVSDIYGPDEIEELLEDLNRLELAAFETEDIQDFDIDGSQLGQDPHGSAAAASRFYTHRRRSGRHSQRRRNPHHLQQPGPSLQQQQNAHNPAASPTFSVRSWDSHARYQSPYDDEYEGVEVGPPLLPSAPPHLHPSHARHHPHPRLLHPDPNDDFGVGAATFHDDDADDEADNGSGLDLEDGGGGGDSAGIFPSRPINSILCYCDTSTLRNPKTILRVILVLTAVACLSAVLASTNTAKAGLFLLRLRLMMFICIFTILFTAFVLFLYISHLNAVMPVEIARMQTVAYLLLTIAFGVSSYLLVDLHPPSSLGRSSSEDSFWTKYHLIIAAMLGFLCCVEAFFCIWNCGRTRPGGGDSYDGQKELRLPESSTHFTLQETNLAAREDKGENEQQQRKKKQYLVNENFNNPSQAKHNQQQQPSAPPEQSSSSKKPSSMKPSSSSVVAIPPPPTAKGKNSNNVHSNGKTNKNNKNNGVAKSKSHDSAATTIDHPLDGGGDGEPATTLTLTHALVESTLKSSTACGRNTGAIPKQKKKANANVAVNNHLDEILSVPLDDDDGVESSLKKTANGNGNSSSRHEQ